MRLIDADALMEDIEQTVRFSCRDGVPSAEMRGANKVIDRIEVAPTISPDEVRGVGEWKEIEVMPKAYDICGVETWASKMQCCNCGFTTFAIEGHFSQHNFCPSCGARMKGAEDGTTD